MNLITIIGILMLSAFVVPVIIIMQKQKREKNKLEKLLKEVESENNIRIDRHETWRNKVIGVDTTSGRAVMIHKEDSGNQITVVDLHLFSRCEMVKTMTASEIDSSLQAVKSVKIRFASRDKSKRDQHFVLFEEEIDLDLGSELRIANSWVEQFNNLIRVLLKAA